MAHNKTIPILLFLALVYGHLSPKPQQSAPQSPALQSIGLLRGKVYDGSKRPGHCLVAINVSRDIYFKLTINDQILKGGLLKAGPNLVDFYVSGLFEKPGIYHYNLITKEKGKTTNRPVIIESTIKPTHERKQTPKVAPKSQSRVSMFVANQLLASKQKHHQMKLTAKTAGEPRAIDYGQYNPTSGRYQALDRAGFSPLLLVGLAVKEIKKNRDRERAKVEIKTERTIYFDYLEDSGGQEKNKRRLSIKITAVGIH